MPAVREHTYEWFRNGEAWRFEGSRPVSALADSIIDGMKAVQELRARGVNITLEQLLAMGRTLNHFYCESLIAR